MLFALLAITGWAFAIEVPDLRPPPKSYIGPEYTIGLDIWYINNDGFFQVEGGRKIHIPQDTEFTTGSDIYPGFIRIRGLGPFFPDLRIHAYRFAFQGALKYTENTRFGNVVFAPGSRTLLNVYGIGVLATYYSNPFGYANAELKYGAEIRRFGGEIGMSGEDANRRAPVELQFDVGGNLISYLPLVHLGATYSFTEPRLLATAESEFLLIGQYTFYDTRVMVEYRLFGILVGVGYRVNFFGGNIESKETDIAVYTKGTFLRFSLVSFVL